MRIRIIVTIVLLLVILIFAGLIRGYTFTLPHDNGDQLFYLGLAMKLDQFGFNGYTLRNIDLQGNNYLLQFLPGEVENGGLLQFLAKNGVSYYDEPLFHRSYGFPYVLMLAHRLLAHGEPYTTLITSVKDAAGRVSSLYSDKMWPLQFYAAVVPFTFSLLFIVATFFLARSFFSFKIALVSCFLIAISPIDILSAQKVWADSMVSFFVTMTVFLFFMARDKSNLVLAFLAGIACGIGVVAKQTGGFIVIALLLFHLWQNRTALLKPDKIGKILLDKYLLIFALGLFLVSCHWFYAVAKVYGNPLYSPTQSGIEKEVGWFMMLAQRPRLIYLVSIPYLVPVFALLYLAIAGGFFIRGFLDEKKIFLIIWYAVYLVLLIAMQGKENRYMLPAYPAIAMLSAAVLERIENFIAARSKASYGTFFIILVLVSCALWSVPIGIEHARANLALILKPF
ncbi:MAG: phospholipid carrier-dependent glycosyltransferase [Candidatus Omnitrophota bacterium]